jgi:hypothetical protein
MRSQPIRLVWCKDPAGYEAKQGQPDDPDYVSGSVLRIVGRSGPKAKLARYMMGLGYHHVYVDLANMAGTPEGACAFAGKWGQLRQESVDLPWHFELGEEFENYERISAVVRTTLEHYSRNGISSLNEDKTRTRLFAGASPLSYNLVPRFLRRPYQSAYTVAFDVNNLQAFCMLEMALALTNGAEFIRCERCRKFKVKATKGPVGRFCSNACRQRNHHARGK